MDELTGSLLLFATLLTSVLLSAAGSALKNSHPSVLSQRRDAGAPGSGLAHRLASQATRLILTLRAGQSLLRLIGAGLALATYTSRLASMRGLPLIGGLIAILAATWLLFGLLGFVVEHYVLRDPVRWALTLAPLIAATEALFSPVVWLMLQLARWGPRSPSGRSYPMVTEEEIMTLVTAGEEGGVIEEEEKSMIYSIFQLGDTLAREVMVPRIDVVAFEAATPIQDATDKLIQTGFSRAPVFVDTIDNITGILYVKDLLAAWRQGIRGNRLADLTRQAYFVPEAKKVDELLTEMQAHRIQMAIVVDEYGGTAGLVTFEDIVEEIVGEVRDEYDFAEELPFQRIEDGEYVFAGGIDLDDVNQLVDATLPKDTSETLGGFIYSHLGRVPSPGEVLEAGGLQLTVEQVVGRRIRKVRAHRIEVEEDGGSSADENHRSAAE